MNIRINDHIITLDGNTVNILRMERNYPTIKLHFDNEESFTSVVKRIINITLMENYMFGLIADNQLNNDDTSG